MASSPAQHALAKLAECPRAPDSALTWLVAACTGYSRRAQGTIFSPRKNAEKVGSLTSTTPFIELPKDTLIRPPGTRPWSRRPSRTAILEAATANWLKRDRKSTRLNSSHV